MNKKNLNNPPRLLETNDIGPRLQEAAAVSFDEQRLAKSRTAIFARIATLSSQTSGLFRFSMFGRRTLAWTAAGLLLLMSAGAAAVIYLHVVDMPPGSDDATVNEDMSGDVSKRKSGAAPKSGLSTVLSTSVPTQDVSNIEPGVDAGVSPVLEAPTKPRYTADKVPADESTLDEQVRLFNKAKALLASGEFESAVRQLHRLKQRFPAGALSLEADELKARGLAGLHRYKEASETVAILIRAKIPTRKRAQLFRFLGDLQVKQNRCDTAVESYRRALGLGLSDAESDAAKAGIRKCVL